jgi:ATP-dependent Clp protease protease subunit
MILANESVRLRERLNDILAECTSQPREVIERDTDRDYYMDAYKAVEYGLIDQVLSPLPVPARSTTSNGKKPAG